MILIRFRLQDIGDGGRDPFELKLFFNPEDQEVAMAEIHNQDFIFKIISDWQVSAAHRGDWYIKGCQDNALHRGSRHHYNQSNQTSYYESEFNKELRLAFPEIENRRYHGTFNTETRVMHIDS